MRILLDLCKALNSKLRCARMLFARLTPGTSLRQAVLKAHQSDQLVRLLEILLKRQNLRFGTTFKVSRQRLLMLQLRPIDSLALLV